MLAPNAETPRAVDKEVSREWAEQLELGMMVSIVIPDKGTIAARVVAIIQEKGQISRIFVKRDYLAYLAFRVVDKPSTEAAVIQKVLTLSELIAQR